ncbi:unnamed protein product, partial [Musa textilis]
RGLSRFPPTQTGSPEAPSRVGGWICGRFARSGHGRGRLLHDANFRLLPRSIGLDLH